MDETSDSESSSSAHSRQGSDDGSETSSDGGFDELRNDWKDNPCPRMTSIGHLNEAARVGHAVVDKYASIDPFPDDEADDPQHKSNPYHNVSAIAQELERAQNGLEDSWKTAKAVFDREHAKLQQQQQTENVQLRDDADLDFRDHDDDDKKDTKDQLLPAVSLDTHIDWGAPLNLDMEASLDDVRGTFGDETENDKNSEHSKSAEDTNDDDDDDRMDPDDFRAMYMELMTETFADDLEQLQAQDASKIDVDILADCLETGIDFLEPHEKNRKSFFRSLGWAPGDEMIAEHDDTGPTIHELRQRELGYKFPPSEDKAVVANDA